MRVLSFFISLLALIISIIALSHSYPHNPNLGYDYSGLLVCILSLLVTILIGWQVINVISLEKKMKDIVKNELDNLDFKFLKLKGDNLFAVALSFWDSCKLKSYAYFVYAIGEYIECNDVPNINICFENMKELLDEIDKKLSKNPINKTLIEDEELNKAISDLKRHDDFKYFEYEFNNIEKRRKEIVNKYI